MQCFCAAPIRVGYRLKSPSFSYFRPYYGEFKVYLTSSLKLDVSQLSIDSFFWDKGPRLWMYLKLFPRYNDSHSHTFNTSEVQRIRGVFTSWEFPRTDLFGPYELLNFTLLGPYSDGMCFSKTFPSTCVFYTKLCRMVFVLLLQQHLKIFDNQNYRIIWQVLMLYICIFDMLDRIK